MVLGILLVGVTGGYISNIINGGGWGTDKKVAPAPTPKKGIEYFTPTRTANTN